MSDKPLQRMSELLNINQCDIVPEGRIVASHTEIIDGREITVIEQFDLIGFSFVPIEQ